jgi:uncharacterized protein with HEPN domain
VRGDQDRILDMIEMCDLLVEHASDRSRLTDDPVIQAAAQRWIEVLGEAASNVSDQTKRSHPEVVWREIIGIRVILAHAYFHVEHDIIGNVIEHDIPLLRAQLQSIAESLVDP